MHLLVGFAVLVGLIAFAFGAQTARDVVRLCLFAFVTTVLAGLTYFAVDVWRELHATEESAKIPEDTAELRRTCAEWQAHPNDAPRMCFAVLERRLP